MCMHLFFVILIILAVAGGAAGIFKMLRLQEEYDREQLSDDLKKFLAGELEISDEKFFDMALIYPDDADPLEGVYAIHNRSRGLMLVEPSEDLFHDAVNALKGVSNRDIASDFAHSRLSLRLYPCRDDETATGCLRRVRKELGITRGTDYAAMDDRDIGQRIPKRDSRRTARAAEQERRFSGRDW